MNAIQIREVGHELRSRSATVTLIVTSIVAALAAVAGLTVWVSVAAAVAAVLTGLRMLNSELIVPVRTHAATNATIAIWADKSSSKGFSQMGTAVQIAPGRWLTAAHLVIGDEVKTSLRIDGNWIDASVVYIDRDSDLAVLNADGKWAWQARLARSLPSPGDKIYIVGWTTRPDADGDRSMRWVTEYTVQGPGGGTMLVLAGPAPQRGFSGGAVVDVSSGRLVAILSNYHPGTDRTFGLPTPAIAEAISVLALPAEYR